MLLEFTVENFRSFGKEAKLDLMASNGIKDNPDKGTSLMGTGVGAGKVLNSVAIYGANSSGKSNLLRAVGTMRFIVLNSVKLNEHDTLPYEPFLLSTRDPRPTRFEIVYYETDTRATFTYGFEYTEDAIQKEWLVAKWPRRGIKQLFFREPDQPVSVDYSNFEEGIRARDTLLLNKNRLFLSLVGQAGGEISNGVINWFQNSLRVISGIEDTYSKYTRKLVFNNPEAKENVQAFLGKMKLGFEKFVPQKIDFESIGYPPGLPKELIAQLRNDPYIQITSIHNVYNDAGEVVRTESLDLDDQESAGTNKIFSLSVPLLEALTSGKTLLIDELDSQMHPLISWMLVEMFNKVEDNSTCAQLIFTTHDTNLLSSELFRRDQIWFTEKDTTESTSLYPLIRAHEKSDSLNHAPRNDSNYQRNYIQGKYGAIPYLTCERPDLKA